MSLHRDLFSDEYASFLIEIVGAARRRAHRITTKGWGLADGERHIRNWLRQRRPSEAAVLLTALDQGARVPSWAENGTELVLVVRPDATPSWPKSRPDPIHLPPTDETIEFVNMKLAVWLEHAVNDLAFLIAAPDPEWAELVTRAFDPDRGWCDPQNGGGLPTLTNVLTMRAGSHAQRLRAFALCDGDSKCPGTMAPSARKLRTACVGLGIPVHVTERRAIENYVPLRALRRWANEPTRKAWVAAFEALEAEQRDHFKLKPGAKGGFHNHGHHEATPSEREGATALYGNLLCDTSHPLWLGPPADISQLWRAGINVHDVADDAGSVERRRILRTLFQAL